MLSLIRSHGQLSKAQIAEITGLAAQTASVISRSLVEAGLLVEGAPVRGKIGQPYVPLSLNPDGALFLGVHLDRHEAKAALVNFTGRIVAEKAIELAGLDLKRVARFVRDTTNRFRSTYPIDDRSRFQGIGISIASGSLGSDRTALPWKEIESTFDELGQTLDLSVFVSSDAVAACSAELIYGLGSGIEDFLYLFIDQSISGGIVQQGRISFSRDDQGANLGKIFVPGADGRPVPLRALALGTEQGAAGTKTVELLARGIAYAVTAAAAVVPCRTVIIDGSIPAERLQQVTVKLRTALAQLDVPEAAEMSVREGSRDRKSVALGAACLPLADRFYPSETDFTRS
ncbi:ROK family protein [Mesorhizobium sp. BAC0120]|uniref:ROK family protein n=1 Tax=Mesorhizobium sp. BAC0120 TaxID=3090670 RepID=UPI00298C975B|nr:ROK family protein [Mesorhizobium sp. BAC0120]MDW6021239.1 ROK family protein [Mesorhizobium sp. BAC0120]